ncbi:hypothetical protein IPL85_04155 [Candidatus Saccharibacteria bacterium]|nr:MAG: hypothetical protein IPL85_04155 [Candidatus Saccharibacteria bacterium]
MDIFIPPSRRSAPEALTNEFRLFYDPRHDFERSDTAEQLLWLSRGRSISPDPDVSLHVGSRILARELAHTRLIAIGRHDNAGGLNIPHQELDSIVDLAYFDAHRTIRALEKGISRLLCDYPDIAAQAKKEDPERILLFGAMGSSLSHLGQRRRNGNQYAQHPLESTMIAEVIEKRQFGTVSPEQYSVQSAILKYVLYAHDEIEDDMSSEEGKRNHSFLAKKKVHMTPLVHYMLLQYLGYTEEVADYASDGLLPLTKTVGLSGRRNWYDYIRELASAAPVAPSGFEGIITEVKEIEMSHNSEVDKDNHPAESTLTGDNLRLAEVKYYRRKKDYDWAREELRRYTTYLSGYPAAIAQHVGAVSAEDIKRHKGAGSLSTMLVPDLLVASFFAGNQAT